MKTVLYTDDINLLEAIEKALDVIEYTVAEVLDGCYESIVVCALAEDVRTNEVLIRSLVNRRNRVLLLQRLPQIEPARHYLSLGIYGYGNAMMDPLFLHSAISALKKGMMWLHPEITAKMVELLTPSRGNNRDFLERLSEREREIALLLLEGKTYNAIADCTQITPRTVKAHATHIYQKLQVKDRLDFALQYK
ncbi:MAG: LuxR C-terminal-related transcriptional regulator [Sulfuricurvum sp.]|uniref:helix-turn-helix transcriptional regulator n=1 Tax=Sulfuricurvum sp. TaxID=2025608 RepID=UPI00262C2DA4|nr:LuxR C-terminal-related transcriptional regulator [Sulfuricurvum sp.]MDD5118581.1 LuxR C-terminal-related transcriptional regulator [Sulfuricurvum sp.]